MANSNYTTCVGGFLAFMADVEIQTAPTDAVPVALEILLADVLATPPVEIRVQGE